MKSLASFRQLESIMGSRTALVNGSEYGMVITGQFRSNE
jgi:hypothetical protein